MFYNKLTACNKAKGEGEWEGGRRDGGQQFLHSLPVLNHPTWEWKSGAERELEWRKRLLLVVFFFWPKKKKNFYRSICLVVLAASVVSECIDGGEQKFRGCVLYCFGWASELKCIKSCCHHAAVTIFRQKCRSWAARVMILTGRGWCWNCQGDCYTCNTSGRWGENLLLLLYHSVPFCCYKVAGIDFACAPPSKSVVTSFLPEMIYLRCSIVSHISILLGQNVNTETILKGYTVNI